MSSNRPPVWTKLERLSTELQSKANAWQSLDSLKPRTKNELQKITQSTHSISQPVSDIWYPKKKITNPLTPLVMNSCKPSHKLDSSKSSCKDNQQTTTDPEAVETTMATMQDHVDTEEEEEALFLEDGARVEAPARHTIQRTTATTKTTTILNLSNKPRKRRIHKAKNRSSALQHSFRRYQTRRKTSTLLSRMDSNNYPSIAFVSSQRWLSNSIQLNASTLATQNDSTQSNGTTSRQRGSTEISASRHYRSFPFSEYGLPVKFFHDPRTNKTKTDFGLSEDQQLYPMPAFQNGRNPSSQRNNGKKRLHMQE
ncbi:hypothetical protein G6F48_013246 [Rhizopus delemar]|nr:hypothetical protein G6F48_013246 [Rhizopus delemar]